MPCEVWRLTPGTLIPQPRPNGPLPFPVLYVRFKCGWKPLRPGGSAIGTEKFPVPVCRSGANFSPMPCSAPPPLGSVIPELEVVGDFLLIVHLTRVRRLSHQKHLCGPRQRYSSGTDKSSQIGPRH